MAVWLRDKNGGSGREAEWVMLFIKCAKNECVPDCRKCNRKKTITHHILGNIFRF